jgi:hypothetical protein
VSEGAFARSEALGSNDPEGMLGRTQPAPAPQRRNWSAIALGALLAAAAAYLGTNAWHASKHAPASSGSGAALAAAPALKVPEPSAHPAALAAAASAASSAAPSPAPSSAAAAAPPDAPRTVQLTLHGAPAGTRVWLGNTPLGDAPGPLRLPLGETPLELRVAANGYDPQKLRVTPLEDQSIEVQLKKHALHPNKPGSDIPSDLESPF